VKVFPGYASRIENQLIGANTLEIRTNVDSAYEKITQAMFDSLKQMAKLEGEGEDKGQLNYHVILIGGSNLISYLKLRHFHSVLKKTCVTSLRRFPKWMWLL